MDVEKILDFLNYLGFERIQLKMLIYKAAMLLALTGLSRAQEICYLDIRYLIKHSFGYTFHFYKLKTTHKIPEFQLPPKIYVFVTTLSRT